MILLPLRAKFITYQGARQPNYAPVFHVYNQLSGTKQ